MTGQYDYLTTPEDGQRTASKIKNAEFIEMAKIGHFPMSENHAVFRDYLMQALELLRSRTSVSS